MHKIDRMHQVMFAELGDRCLDARFTMDFPVRDRTLPLSIEGYFAKVKVKGQSFWYYRSRGADGSRKDSYVGKVDDAEITERVERFATLKDDLKARRSLVRSLTGQAGLPAPDRFTGAVVERLADAGLFRLRGALVGTVAFQAYAGILGVRLPSAALQTGDADFAKFHSVSAMVGDSIPPILEVLREVDPTFRDLPGFGDKARSARFVNSAGYKVEFLTPNRGSEDHAGRPAEMPSLGGASALPMRFLDFLIKDTVRTVLLHNGGVSVSVPTPQRYAVHKLIVASRRLSDGNGALKRAKDVFQAGTLIRAMGEARMHQDLADAFSEAWGRGPAWQEAVTRGLSYLDAEERDAVHDILGEGLRGIGEDPGEFGLPSAPEP